MVTPPFQSRDSCPSLCRSITEVSPGYRAPAENLKAHLPPPPLPLLILGTICGCRLGEVRDGGEEDGGLK
jgi:hypothetical protein